MGVMKEYKKQQDMIRIMKKKINAGSKETLISEGTLFMF